MKKSLTNKNKVLEYITNWKKLPILTICATIAHKDQKNKL